MERDFLGIGGKEECRGSHNESAVQWPFSNKISILPQIMPLMAGQEERQKMAVYEQISTSGFQPLSIMESSETKHEPSLMLASQKFHNLVRQEMHQLSVHVKPFRVIESSAASKLHPRKAITFPVASHPSTPVRPSSLSFDVNGFPNGPDSAAVSLKQQQPSGTRTAAKVPIMGSAVGAFSTWKPQRPSALTAQLTILYNGAVNVYDGVPREKAQEIMLLASNVAKVASSNLNGRTGEPVLEPKEVAELDGPNEKLMQDQSLNNVEAKYLPLSRLSRTPTSEAQCGSSSSNMDDETGEQNAEPLAELLETANTAVCCFSSAPLARGAVPQFRKASLARFLEKRKERLTKPVPYSTKKLADSPWF